jgi:hypothetical protein
MLVPILPLSFPTVPDPIPGEQHWSANVTSAHHSLSEAYHHAAALLGQEDGDALRLCIHSEQIFCCMTPILEAMEPEIDNHGWISESMHTLAGVMSQPETYAFAADRM